MSNMFFVVCIVLIGCATAVILNYLETRKGNEKRDASIDETLAQMDALEERVRVLERIVTENKIDLKREIDRL